MDKKTIEAKIKESERKLRDLSEDYFFLSKDKKMERSILYSEILKTEEQLKRLKEVNC